MDNFYIGWNGPPTPEVGSTLKKVLLSLFCLLLPLAFFLVNFQKPFSNAIFEFGNPKQFTGIYHSQPVPLLVAKDKTYLLVGYGKFGAKSIMQNIAKQKKQSLEGKQITVKATLIAGDGKYLLELTDEESSLQSISSALPVEKATEKNQIKQIPNIQGEVIDPKCYFGVMKPGEGKIHKSCAIRCLSGGIPAVLRIPHSSSSEY
ncbi:MAG: hypothetical protein AAF518_26840, partial [Spirochaetota bacterium]